MNLIDGRVEEGAFLSDGMKIGSPGLPDGPITLGFRAEDASVVGVGGDLNKPIYSIELLGDATMVTVRVAGALVSVKADKNFRAEIGDMVSIQIPEDQCHLFDPESGDRIRRVEAA